MSRSLGPTLPDALLTRLTARDPDDWLDRVVILTTVDPFGWPHPALLSYAELLALDSGRLRLALYAGTRSTRHLQDSGRAALVFAEPELVCYVKAEALPLPTVPDATGLARFELQVRDVLEDRAEGEEAGSRLTSGITVEWPGGGSAAAIRHARLRRLLSI